MPLAKELWGTGRGLLPVAVEPELCLLLARYRDLVLSLDLFEEGFLLGPLLLLEVLIRVRSLIQRHT